MTNKLDYSILKKDLSAKTVIMPWQKALLIAILVLTYYSFTFEYSPSVFWFTIVFNGLYILNTSYRLWMLLTGAQMLDSDLAHHQKLVLSNDDMPQYTVLIPMFFEAAVVPHLIKSMLSMDYPVDKLQILLILEEEDQETLEAVKLVNPPSYFQTVIVPKSLPQTKAKACNYAMQFATGEIICIYDAEDIPDPLQLKKVVSMFAESDPSIISIQCRLSFYNGGENLLTSMFEIEYQTLYNFLLPVASYYNYPIPLGGSSNHFKATVLKELGGWDSYNVTEDADLGLRLAAVGYRARILYSYTGEEAPTSVGAWIKQRTRWLKGYFHTFLIYFRYPFSIWKSYRFFGNIFFLYMMFLGPILTLTAPIGIILSFFIIFQMHSIPYYDEVFLRYFTWCNLFYTLLNFLFSAYIVSKLSGHRYLRFKWVLFIFYFPLLIYAAFRAVRQLATDPHKWEKTVHGVSTFNKQHTD